MPDESLASQILNWMDETETVLRDSGWGQALTLDDMCVWDMLKVPLYLKSLRLARDSQDLVGAPPFKSAALLSGLRSALRIRTRLQVAQAALYSSFPTETKVVFLPVEPTHTKVQLPVARELLALGFSCEFVTSKHKTFAELHNRGFSPIHQNVLLDSLNKSIERDCREQINLINSLKPIEIPEFPRNISIDTIWDSIRAVLLSNMQPVLRALRLTERIFETMSPHVLMVGNDLTVEGRVASTLARSRNIHSMCLMHGNVFSSLHNYHIVSTFFVYGEIDKLRLKQSGCTDTEIEISGPTYLDELPIQSGVLHPQVSAYLKLDKSSSVILVALSGHGDSISLEHHLLTIEYVMRLSVLMPNLTFVAKLHRKDRREYYDRVALKVPQNRLIVVEYGAKGTPESIFDWLQGIRLLLTGASTVAVEAMLMQVPVITMDYLAELHDVPFIDCGASYHVRSLKELISTVEDFNNGQLPFARHQVNEFLKATFGLLDGGAVQRVVSRIQQVARPV